VSRYVRVSSLAELGDGEMIGVGAGKDDVCLARVGDEVYAIGNLCTHALAWLDSGELLAEVREVECPLHGGRFDLRTGEPTSLPCEEAVKSYPVRIVEGDIQVLIEDA
jgi:nitrite reductase/ring-hydroxylating ferredoxin subunit